MTDSRPQSALREWRANIRHPGVLAAIAGIGGIFGLAGPFGTDEVLRLIPRLAYWIALAALTYSIGFVTSAALWPRLRRLPPWGGVALVGLATGLPVSAAVTGLNLAVFGILPRWADLPGFVATITAVSVIVTALLRVLDGHLSPGPAAARPAPPPILSRLPLDKRGPLVALSVEDHYVRVRTTQGEELVLMRLSDAMNQVGAIRGAQVHRSHWVAFGHVRSARRDGDRAFLDMAVGPEIPVSRANLPKLKEAGLLPR